MTDATSVRRGRGFPLEEAARLLRDGVYLPNYPIELIAAAWQLNFEQLRATRSRQTAAGLRPSDADGLAPGASQTGKDNG